MTALRWGIAILAGLIYVTYTGIFFADWSRLVQTSSLPKPALLLYCLLTGGAISAVLALASAIKRRTLGAVVAVVILPLEIILGFVLITLGFGYWLSMKLVFFVSLVLLLRLNLPRP
jgi:hypothetical protein